jgi:hypothetical protein
MGIFIIILSVSPEILGSHYELDSLDEYFPSESVEKLLLLNIRSTKDLLNATNTQKNIKKISRKTGIDEKKLKEWHDFCDLLQIDGVGPKVAKIMTLCEVKTLKDLEKSDPLELLKKIKKTNDEKQILGKLPAEDTVISWINHAKEINKKSK